MRRTGEVRSIERQMILDGDDGERYPLGAFVGTSPSQIKQHIINSIKKLLDYDMDEEDIELEFFDYPLADVVPGINPEEVIAFKAFYKGTQMSLMTLFTLCHEFHGVHYMGHLKYDRPENKKDYENYLEWFEKSNQRVKDEHMVFMIV